jgi:hypothetical protein
VPKIEGLVEGGMKNAGPRNVYLSWVTRQRGAIDAARCVEVLATKLEVLVDQSRRPFGKVRDSNPGRNPAGGVTPTPDPAPAAAAAAAAAPPAAPAADGETVVPGRDALWTDFIAVMTSEYAIANRAGPGEPGAGEFAQALATLAEARDPTARALWLAVVENVPWRNLVIARRLLGDLKECHVLKNGQAVQARPGMGDPDENDLLAAEILSLDDAQIDRHLGAAASQLVHHPWRGCGHDVAPKPTD